MATPLRPMKNAAAIMLSFFIVVSPSDVAQYGDMPPLDQRH
jgi:hypothetical protein